MALILEAALKNALADAIDDYVNAGTAPELVFETSADVEVATIVLDATNAFGNAAGGTISMTGAPKSDTSATGGVVAQFSIYQNAGQTNKVLEGTVATSGADINISNTTVNATETVELTSFSITVP